jgi:hypothetical protein
LDTLPVAPALERSGMAFLDFLKEAFPSGTPEELASLID